MLGLVGFLIGATGVSRDGDSWLTGYALEGPLPEDAEIVAVLLDEEFPNAAAVNQMRIDLAKALQRGAQLILCAGDAIGVGASSGIATWLQNRLRISIRLGGPWDIRPLAHELAQYFANHLAYAHFEWQGEPPEGAQILAELQDHPGLPASARFTYGRSDVILLPVGPRHQAVEAVNAFISLLPPRDSYPEYLDELDIAGETALKAEIEKLEGDLASLRARQGEGRELKRIMYFTDHDLEVEAIRFLDEELRVQARHVAGSDEDGWLQAENGKDWAIVEVKGMGKKNVAKGDVADVISHRHKAERPDDFPSLLIANTFHRSTTLGERDRAVEDGVIRFAASEHVMIVRTLDLLRLKRAVTEDPTAARAFVEAVRKGGGWFEVNAKGQAGLRGS